MRPNRPLQSRTRAGGTRLVGLGFSILAAGWVATAALAQDQSTAGSRPNIVLIVTDDYGYGDAGVYGGGENRGMPTPGLDRMAAEGMQLLSFFAQPSCTPGRAAMQTGRMPVRAA